MCNALSSPPGVRIMSMGKIALAVITTLGLLASIWLSPEMPAQVVKGKKKKDAPVVQPDLDTFKDDQKIVRDAGLKGDGPDLIEYFRKRTLKAPDPKEIAALV